MASLFLGRKEIDDDLLDDIETRLLTADVGVEATTLIVQNLTKRVARKELADSGALYKALQEELASLLRPVEQPLQVDVAREPYVILVVGVNGVGKTTTIGKLAKKLQLEGKKVMLAAGDTFRAAAVEQLQVWGERNRIPVIAQHTGADSASVIFDAVQAAKARGIDVLIADTAGRLHTKDNLMEELKKVRRVIGKLDETAPHEVLLVLDAGTGQNAINQAKQFNLAVELTGLALTKLDGTARGGVIFALAKQFGLPIRYIGVGEGIDDLRTFEADAFVQALFAGGRTHDPLRAGRQTLSQRPRRPARGVLPRAPWRDPLRHRPPGAGKSTLLRLILAMERPTSGKLLLGGQDLGRITTAQIPFLRRQIGVVFQNHQLLTDRTVVDNIALPLQILGMPAGDRQARGLGPGAGEPEGKGRGVAFRPSTGQQQRVGIACAIVHQPALLLADEPTGNLDPRLASEIMGVFEDINRLGTTVLIASHDLALIARMRHRMLTLQRGRIIADREDEA